MLLRIRTLFLLCCLPLAACQSGGMGGGPTSGIDNLLAKSLNDDPVTDLTVIQYEYTDPINTLERKMLIDKSGRVRVLQVAGVEQNNRLAADTNLTEPQRDALLKVFQGFKQLKPQYPVSFGPIYSVTFDGFKVDAGENESAAPQLRRVKSVLDAIAIAALRTAPRPTPPPQAATPPEKVVYILNSDVEYQYTFTLNSGQVIRRKITVSKEEGLLKVKEDMTGPEPHDPSVDAKIHLTQNQLITLASTMKYMPEGDQRYPGIEDGPYFMVKYEGRTITSGGLPSTPASVKNTQLLLEDYAMDAKRFPEPD